ncbi:glycosyltransferase family 4 protein [Telmatospirillum sp. J64-1]|uniref:glycosyltransferase family 4 protein n=1 Tax=Telmatospirillum sp. J64-1 TaxID=2502183 RepID=UPI00115DC22B|nr:glycosyltransferase family 4 protein [Telmatospirillum sp. J64-1]
MRIAQVAPLHEAVPPVSYGGTERIVSYLTEELVAQGHEVTLFASADSLTAAHLESISSRALRLDGTCDDPVPWHLVLLERLAKRAAAFDIIHFHCEFLHLPLARRLPVPSLTTLHGRLDLAGLEALFQEYAEHPLISISDSQRRPLPRANWLATIHHGLPTTLYKPAASPSKDYLLFLGRISREKRLDRAIEIARLGGLPLKVAAKIDRGDREYFEQVIRPMLETPGVEFLGEVGEAEKGPLLSNALALLFPIDWPEPFGLVMAEAMAAGTPTIAYPCGSVPEVLDHGVTGILVRSIAEAVAALPLAEGIDRRACRETFLKRFSARRMAEDYLAAYRRLTLPAALPLSQRRTSTRDEFRAGE